MDRHGLVGAQPVGNRWRAQGHIDGSVRYLGTFDTEQEAHDRYQEAVREVQGLHRETLRAEMEEIEKRVAAAPEFVYDGGKGRGAVLNGMRFRLMEEDKGTTQHLIVAPVLTDTSNLRSYEVRAVDGHPYINPAESRPLLRSYLKPVERTPDVRVIHPHVEGVQPQIGVPEAPANEAGVLGGLVGLQHMESDPVLRALEQLQELTTPEVLKALPKEVADRLVQAKTNLVDGTRVVFAEKQLRESVKKDVLRLLTDSKHDLDWSIQFLEQHLREGSDDVRRVLTIARGAPFPDTLEFLRSHTDIEQSILDEVENETFGNLFMNGENKDTLERVNQRLGVSPWKRTPAVAKRVVVTEDGPSLPVTSMDDILMEE